MTEERSQFDQARRLDEYCEHCVWIADEDDRGYYARGEHEERLDVYDSARFIALLKSMHRNKLQVPTDVLVTVYDLMLKQHDRFSPTSPSYLPPSP